MTLTPFQLSLYRLAQEVGALLAFLKNSVHTGKRALRQPCGNLLVIDLFSTHAEMYLISGNLTSPSECDII